MISIFRGARDGSSLSQMMCKAVSQMVKYTPEIVEAFPVVCQVSCVCVCVTAWEESLQKQCVYLTNSKEEREIKTLIICTTTKRVIGPFDGR